MRRAALTAVSVAALGAIWASGPAPATAHGTAVQRALHRTTHRLEATDSVRRVQEALRDTGHDPGPIDGVLGRQPRAALRDFQRTERLAVTGRIDDATRDRLQVRLSSLRNNTAPSASPRPGAASRPQNP